MEESNNPYSAPRADEEAPAERAIYADGLQDASQGVRFANLLLDEVFFFIVVFALAFFVTMIGHEELAGVFTWPMLLGYYIFFEGVFGATPGKMITRTRVVRLDGSKPRIWQIVGRTFARLIPFEALSFLGSSPGWHDRYSKTRVVRVPR